MSTVRSAGFLLRLLAGAALFTVAQAAMSSVSPFGPPAPGEAPNWFLNSIQGVAVVGVVFFAAGIFSVLAGAADTSSAALPLTIGGAVGVAGMLVWIGGGNLLPIVVLVGAGCIGLTSFVGASAGMALRDAQARWQE